MASNSARYNQDHYAALKARETARELVKAHNMDYATAYFISFRLWQEAPDVSIRSAPHPKASGRGAE